MERVTVSSKGQVAIPKAIRDALNISEGSKLEIDVRGNQIVLAKEPAWRKLRGAASNRDLMKDFGAFRKRERELENSRS